MGGAASSQRKALLEANKLCYSTAITTKHDAPMVLSLSYAPRALTRVVCGFCIIHVHLAHSILRCCLSTSTILKHTHRPCTSTAAGCVKCMAQGLCMCMGTRFLQLRFQYILKLKNTSPFLPSYGLSRGCGTPSSSIFATLARPP